MSNPLSALIEWIVDAVERLGYPGVAAFVALENVFPPIPSEAILPLAGFLAGRGDFWLPAVIVAATIGSVVGALVLYAVGYYFGEHRIRRLIKRYGHWLTIEEAELDRAHTWFDRHGPSVVSFGRLVPIIRSLVSIPAGVERMSLGRFVLYTTIGSGVWNTVLILLGWWLGDQWQEVESYVGIFQYVVLAALVAGVIWFLYHRRPWQQGPALRSRESEVRSQE